MTLDTQKQPTASGDSAPSRWERIPGWGKPSDRFVHGWAIASVVANVGIVATGGAVRLTNSGLGCPTWPQCTSESLVPHPALGIHGAIEFGNRMLTWVLTIIAIATVVAVWRSVRSDRGDRRLAVLLALGIPFQGVIGGITVLTKLNPWVVSLHFLLSMVLVSGATWLMYRTRPGTGTAEPSTRGWAGRVGVTLAWLLYSLSWVAIYLGTVVTGSGPHAGDTDAPRNGLAPTQATQLHADAVFILIGASVALVLAAYAARLPQFRATLIFFGVLILQGVIGIVQYFTDLPIALVIAHMVGSAVLIVGATQLVLAFGADKRGRQS